MCLSVIRVSDIGVSVIRMILWGVDLGVYIIGDVFKRGYLLKVVS